MLIMRTISFKCTLIALLAVLFITVNTAYINAQSEEGSVKNDIETKSEKSSRVKTLKESENKHDSLVINEKEKKKNIEDVIILDPKNIPEDSGFFTENEHIIPPEKIKLIEKINEEKNINEEKIVEVNPEITGGKIQKVFSQGTDLLDKSLHEVLPTEQEQEKEPEKVYKVPVDLGGKTIIYIGGCDRALAYKRSFEITTLTEKIIKDAVLDYKQHLDVTIDIDPEKDIYVIKIDGKPVINVTDEDAKANEVSLIRLLKVWKYNISKTVNKYLEEKLILTDAEIMYFIILGFFVLLLVVSVIELFRRKTEDKVGQLTKAILEKIYHYIKSRRLKRGKVYKEEIEKVINEKINKVSSDIKLIYNAITFLLTVNIILFVVIIALYYHPSTEEMVNSSANNMFAVLFSYADSVYEWFISHDTWRCFIKSLVAVLDATVLIFFLKLIIAILINVSDIILADRVQRAKHLETILKIVDQTLTLLIILGVIIFILYIHGVDMGAVLAGLGIAGVAVGIAAQNLIRDIINGLFFLLEDQFGIEDIIKVDNTIGKVEYMSLRFTMIRDLSGTAHIIPNSQIARVSVYTKDWARAHLDIGIAYKEDIDTAVRLIDETADKLREEYPEIIIERHKIMGVNSLGDSSVDIKLLIKTAPGEQWSVEREFRKRIKYAFDKNNIEIPFPHRTVYMPQNIGYNHPAQQDSNIENDSQHNENE